MAAATDVMDSKHVDLGALLDARHGAVVTLVAGQTRLAAHKAVLAARSRVFEDMFRQRKVNASTNEMHIPNMEGPVLRQLLAYCYTLRAPQLPPRLGPQLLAAAWEYRLMGLVDECEEQVAAQMSMETAAAAAVVALKCGCRRLQKSAITFIRSHNLQVMATQGWADAVRCYPEVVVKLTQLLTEPPAGSRAPAAAQRWPTTSAQSQQQSSRSHQTPVAAVPAMPHRQTPTPAGDAASRLRAPAAPEKLPTAVTPPQRRTPAAPAAPAPPTPRQRTHSSEDAAASRLRSLSPKEKGERLIDAAAEGRVEDVEALLAAGADVGARDGDTMTALHHAAAAGHVEVARCLLLAGAQVDTRDDEQKRPLHYAAVKGHTAVVRLLLASSADPNARGEGGDTPLHWAAAFGHTEAAAALMLAGADKGAMNNDGENPLDAARDFNQQRIIDLLK